MVPWGVALVAVVLLVAWWLGGIWIIQEPERGVVLRFGEYHRTMDPGFNWAPYFVDSAVTVNVDRVRNAEIGFRQQGSSVAVVPREALMLTEDENIVDLQFAVQYRVQDPAQFLFENREPEIALRQATESAVREIVGRSKMDFVLTEGRGAVATEVQGLIQEILDRYRTGLRVMSVNMQNAQPPAQVQDAFLDAIKAREDQERIINEARAYQADVVPKARGEANAILAQAEAYQERVEAIALGDASRFEQVLEAYRAAPEITRDRLYPGGDRVGAREHEQGDGGHPGGQQPHVPAARPDHPLARRRGGPGTPVVRSGGRLDDARGCDRRRPAALTGDRRREDALMNLKALLVLVAGFGILAALSVFTVDEREAAILLQFGKVERTDLEPGLHFKAPVVQNVLKFDSRIQTLDSDPQNYLTSEKKNVIVDSFVKWRIEDVRRFYTSAGGSILQANNRLGR